MGTTATRKAAATIGAQTDEQWEDALGAMLSFSSTERQRRGHLALEAVERFYSYDRWSEAWRRAVGL